MHSLTSIAPPTCLSQWLHNAWSHEADVRSVEVEGAAVRYRDWGAPNAKAPGLVFLHGFLAHAHWWDHIAPHFAERHHAIATDLTGMGDSDRRPVYSRRQFARETLAVIEDAGLRDVTLIAHSFGSVSALYAALLAPERIARVIVLDAFVFRAPKLEAREEPEAEKLYASREEALSRYRLKPPGLWPISEIFNYLARHSLRETDGRWSWKFDPQLFVSALDDGIRDELVGLATPTDFIRAENSEIIDAAAAASFVENLPGCGTPVTVPLSHHHVMIEQPVALVSALQGLLASPR